jgi:hypothetical protein
MSVEIDWKHEGERFEQEVYGLVRAMTVKAMQRLNRLRPGCVIRRPSRSACHHDPSRGSSRWAGRGSSRSF